jgi:hypothetical protein
MIGNNILIYPNIAGMQYGLLVEEIIKNNYYKKEEIKIIRNKKIECNYNETSIEEMIDNVTEFVIDEYVEIKMPFSIREICIANRILKGNYQEIKNKYLNLYENLKTYLIQNKIDKIISYALSDGITMTLFNVANNLGIEFEYLINTRIGEGMLKSNRIDTGPQDFEKKFQKNKEILLNYKEEYEKYYNELTEFNRSRIQPKYAADKKLSSQNFFNFDKKNLLKIIIKTIKTKDEKFIDEGLFELINARISRAYQINYYHKKIKINTKEDLKGIKYFIYPLHFHPECSTLIQGRWIHDQIKIIQLISANMPSNYKLIVKEHKIAIGRRPLNFYKTIHDIPDVMFADESMFMGDLIINSMGLITIAGTAGLEAYLLGKNIGVIGDVYYMKVPGVTTIHDVSKMRENLNIIIKGEIMHDIDRIALFKTLTKEGELIDNYHPTHLDKMTIHGMEKLYFKC